MFVGIEPLLAFVLWVIPAGLWTAQRIRTRRAAAQRQQVEAVATREVVYAQLPFKRFGVAKTDLELSRAVPGGDAEEEGYLVLKMNAMLRRDAGNVLVPVKGFEGTPVPVIETHAQDADYWTICLN